jgi:spore coat polysaccharide biosynthesis protein SpsF
MSKIYVCLQVRTSSKRMPYKCLLPIKNIESIKILINRIKSKKYSLNILTSNHPSDDFLVKKIKDTNCKIYRGDLDNVYKRFLNFSKKLNDDDIVVRVTGDNIFVDHNLINEVVNYFKKNNYNYTSIDRKKSKLPYGISVEVFNLRTFRKWNAISNYEEEHVTPRILKFEKNIGFFQKKNLKNFYNLSCTMDTIFDYHKIKLCFEKSKSIKTNYVDLCNILKNIKKREINNKNETYSKIIIGTAQFDGKYGVANKSIFKKLEIKKLLNEAYAVGVNKIDTATTYKNAHSLLLKIPVISKFEITSKDKIIEKKIKKFESSFFRVAKSFGRKNLKYFLIHSSNKFTQNKDKIFKITKKNKQLSNKIGISLYEPNEIKKENLNFFKNIQIPFNILDRRWKDYLNKKNVYIRSIYLQGIFFCKEKDIPQNIKSDVVNLKNKLLYLVKKLERINLQDLLVNYVRYYKFEGNIYGFDNIQQLRELMFYYNRPILNSNEVKLINKKLKSSEKVIDPRKWH